MKLTIGADPEVVLYDKNAKAYVSAHDLVPGTKDKPHKLKNGACQADGTALEFNIDPASSANEFADNLASVMAQCKDLLPKHIGIQFTPSVVFAAEYFSKLPDKVKELGCDPDYNGYKGGINPMPRRDKSNATLCTYGGHIHLGWGKGYQRSDVAHMYDCRMLAQRLDTYFRPYKRHWDNDKNRGALYGANAPFRPKPYGVEYRALSNAWLNNPKLWPWIFDSCQWVFKHALEGKPFTPTPLNYGYDGTWYGGNPGTEVRRNFGSNDNPVFPNG